VVADLADPQTHRCQLVGIRGPPAVVHYETSTDAVWPALASEVWAERERVLGTSIDVEVVGARGFEPAIPTTRIVVPGWIAETLSREA
jgi:hypothetical protein